MDTNAVTSTQTASVERRELSGCEMELKQKEDELRTLKVDVLRLEETVKEQADMIERLKNELQSKASSPSERALLSTSHRISEQETRVLHFTISQLRDELRESKQEVQSTRAILETQKTLCANQEKEICKRRQQLDESVEALEQMREELKEARKKASGLDWKLKERTLKEQIETERLEYTRKITTLEARIKMMRQREDSMLEDIERLRTSLEESQKNHEEHIKSCTQHAQELRKKTDELSTLRCRLEAVESTKAHQNTTSQRSDSMEDMLVSQVKSLTAQINEMRSARNYDEHVSNLEKNVGSLSATNEFLEKQLKDSKTEVTRLKEELEKCRKEINDLKSEIEKGDERLVECENKAELTSRYLADENSKIKQQKAEIRCELIALKREYAKLRDTTQTTANESELSELRQEVTSLNQKLQLADEALRERVVPIKLEPMEIDTSTVSRKQEMSRKDVRDSEQQGTTTESAEAGKENLAPLHKPQDSCTQTHRTESVSIKKEQCEECVKLNEQIVSLKNHVKTLQSSDQTPNDQKNERMEKELNEKCAIQKAIGAKLQKELVEARSKNDELRKALHVLDEQCDKLMEVKRRAEAGRKKAVERVAAINEELNETRREKDRLQQTEVDYKRLLQERERLVKKIDYLTEELHETHTDYRGELAKLAKQMNETKRNDASGSESSAIKVEALETEKRQMESTLRSMERQVEQSKNECDLRDNEVKELRASQCELIEENAKLRDGLAIAIAKAERFKEDLEIVKDANSALNEDLKKARDDKSNAIVRADTLQQAIGEKERLVAYLQSQLHMRSTTKIKHSSSSRSTLISVASESSLADVEISDQDEQDNVPSRKRSIQQGNELSSRITRYTSVSVPHNTPFNSTSANELSRTPITDRFENSAKNLAITSPTPTRVGTMKHDIPHRWKTFLVLKQAKCIGCYEGLARIRHAMKCTECGLMAHRVCTANVANTCGLPEQCADYYLDLYTTNSTGNMSGWVKVWRSDDLAFSKWRGAWATISDQKLCFFDKDSVSNTFQHGSPFLSVNLNADQWRLHMQSVLNVDVTKDCVTKDSLALLIELRLSDGSLYMLAPTVQAKERWVRALQAATDRRMFVQRQPTLSTAAANKMLIALDAPLNLTINCSQMLGEWLLIGAQEGLFITQLSSPRVPFVVAGLAAVFDMKLLPDLDMLIAISGLQRQLVQMHVSDLKAGFKCDRPTVRPTVIANLNTCHLITVHTDQRKLIRYLCVADPDQIHILHYSSRLGIFTPFKLISTVEPATCLISMNDGIVFGADQFYYVDMETITSRPIVVAGCPSDFPLAAVAISDRELLLAYHNFGVFTDISGNRTRPENVDWNRAPLEFVFVAPILYVIHNDTLEILQIADYEGANSKTLLDVRDFYRCHCAHYIGRGRSPDEVLFVLSGNERTEIHSFCGSSNEKDRWIFDYVNDKRVLKDCYSPLRKKLRHNEENIEHFETQSNGTRRDTVVVERQTNEIITLYGEEYLV